jgi:hypothetical protein
VFNLKWSALSAALGFVLSLVLSLVSGAGVFSLVRALIFGAVFFVISSLLYWMVKRFLPELLDSEDTSVPDLDMGSHVDISLDGGDDDSSLTSLWKGNGDSSLGIEGFEGLAGDDFSEAGSVSREDGGDFPAAALDQDRETGYTDKDTGEESFPAGDFGFFGSPPADTFPTGFPAKRSGALDAPGPEGLSAAFVPSFPSFGDDIVPKGNGGTPVSVAFPAVERNSTVSEKDASEFRGKEKESALAVQTILKRD